MFEAFVAQYGNPRAGTVARTKTLGLDHCPALRVFSNTVGGGIFADGLLSICSLREAVPDLGGWERWLPPSARLFGTSALGLLLLTQVDDVWIVDTQYGQGVEASFSLGDFFDVIATPEMRRNRLRAPLLAEWMEHGNQLPTHCVLSPTPALALGGSWRADSLAAVSLSVYLTFTAGLFGEQLPPEIRSRSDGQHS